jgi:hypothetical protein
MSRGFSTQVNDALQAQEVRFVMFAKLEFPTGTVYVHNSIGTYTWVTAYAGAFEIGVQYTIDTIGTTDFTAIGASSTPTVGEVFIATGAGSGTGAAIVNWLGVGDLGSISKVEEGTDVSPYAITLTLSGLDATMSSAALTQDYFMRPVTVYLGLLDTDDALLEDPTQIWSGFMDQMNLSVGADGGDAIQLIAESELSRFDKSKNLMYTNAAQQARYSGDLFFSHIHKVEGAKIKWGGATGTSSGPVDNPYTPGDITERREMR